MVGGAPCAVLRVGLLPGGNYRYRLKQKMIVLK